MDQVHTSVDVMKPTTTNRLLKLLAWLLVLIIVVMLLLPSELTDAQLAQIKPGMPLHVARRLLGQENGYSTIAASTPGIFWMKDRKWWNPSLQAKIEDEATACLFSGGSLWVSNNYLLVVEHHDGIVTKTWLFPITRIGGGLQGCIDTIKKYWNDWRK